MFRPIFLTGLARGGTNLLARMLNAGGATRIAIHAFQPWFKSLRNAIIARDAEQWIARRFDPEGPFADGAFDELQVAVLDILHDAVIDLPFAGTELQTLLERLRERASHDAADLIPELGGLAGPSNYRTMMDRILALVGRGYEGYAHYVGLIDTWIIDLLPALARAYPEARFVVVLRDPRAVVASNLKFLDTTPEQVGHVLSIVRQWRKYAALSHQFQRNPLFEGRFCAVRYEDEVRDPERFAAALCEFLDLSYCPAMIDLRQYVDAASDARWQGNSAFVSALERIDPDIATRWRQSLSADALAAVEFCCGPDMEVCGYPTVDSFEQLAADPRVLPFLVKDGQRDCAWRTDTGDAEVDYQREVWRRSLLHEPGQPRKDKIRLAFASSAYFNLIRNKARLFPPT
jgi:hypothetical protein